HSGPGCTHGLEQSHGLRFRNRIRVTNLLKSFAGNLRRPSIVDLWQIQLRGCFLQFWPAPATLISVLMLPCFCGVQKTSKRKTHVFSISGRAKEFLCARFVIQLQQEIIKKTLGRTKEQPPQIACLVRTLRSQWSNYARDAPHWLQIGSAPVPPNSVRLFPRGPESGGRRILNNENARKVGIERHEQRQMCWEVAHNAFEHFPLRLAPHLYVLRHMPSCPRNW